ncbi:MAG: hypothetical protein HY707_08170 [Ignavibacteriae bacterium]|nr:hypothetical protein [Ignavibacteriota bacterium]
MSIHNPTVLFLLFVITIGNLEGAELYEHKRLSHRALEIVLSECEVTYKDSLLCFPAGGVSICIPTLLLDGKTFDELSTMFSDGDDAYARFQERGRSIGEQLERLRGSDIDALLREYASPPHSFDRETLLQTVREIERPGENVVVNYLMYHLIGLKLAQAAGGNPVQRGDALRYTMIMEAKAQSYLIDAFCAGHLLVPLDDFLSRLHPTNNRNAHDFYNTEGVFVINSRQETWQAFGDKVLEWYAPSYLHVLNACCTSLRELLLTYFASMDAVPPALLSWAQTVSAGESPSALVDRWLMIQEGRNYYESTRMPTLLELPMPISAVWSVRTDSLDEMGVHQRKQYPQLREDGLHDPSLEDIDKDFLYPQHAFPQWVRLDFSRPVGEMIKQDVNIASVRYVQNRNQLPSFMGLLVEGSGSKNVANGSIGWSFGAGYGFTDDILFIKNISAGVALIKPSASTLGLFLSPSTGVTVNYPHLPPVVSGTRLSLGYAWGMQQTREDGLALSIGLESNTYPLGFTYAAIHVRLVYQYLQIQPRVHNVAFGVVMQ